MRRGVIDVTGHVVAPGFIDLHSHGGLMILAEPRHEPKVRQGVTTELIGVDGNGVCAVPGSAGPAPTSSSSTLASTAARTSRSTGRPSPGSSTATTAGSPSTSPPSSATRRSGSRRSAGTTCRPMPRPSPTSGRGSARRWRTGRSGCRPGSTTRRAPTPRPRSWRRSRRWRRDLGGIYHTHVRYPLGDGFLDPFREAIEIGRRSGAPAHITHFYHRATFPGPPEQMLALVDDARAEGLDVTFDLYPSEWASTRLLIMLPTWIQAGGVGAAEGAPRGWRRACPDPRRDAGARAHVRRRPRLGRAAARRADATGEPRVGGPDPGRAHARVRARRRRRDLRPAARRGPAAEPGDAGAAPRRDPAVPASTRRR